MKNKEWIDLISKEFNVSRTMAKEMLHSMYVTKNILSVNKDIRQSEKLKQEKEKKELEIYEEMDKEDYFALYD